MTLQFLFAQPAWAAFCPFIAIDSDVPETVLVGFSDFGLYTSKDKGKTWQRSGLPAYPLSDLKLDPQNPGTVYAGTWRGVLKSINGGTTWKNFGLADRNVDALAIYPRNTSVVFARASEGTPQGWIGAMFQSVNGGVDWSPADNWLPTTAVLELSYSPQDHLVIYAGTRTGVFKTADGGKSWSPSSVGLPTGTVRALMVDRQNPGVLYVTYYGSSGVFKSTDGGRTWANASSGLPGVEVAALAQDPIRQSLYAATHGKGLYRSTDRGATWESAGLRDYSVCRVAVSPTDSLSIYAAAGTTLFKTRDGGVRWTAVTEGLPTIHYYH